MPDSLLRYVQEIGRAGRDGQRSRIVAIHDPETAPIYESFINSNSPPPDDYRGVVSALRAGKEKRTDVVVECDIPEQRVQRILEDLVRGELCTRLSEQPYRYVWRGGAATGVPDGLEDAVAARREMLREACAYASGEDCRAIQLARSMGDDPLPDRCGHCDRCRETRPPDLSEATRRAREYLARYCPEIRAVSRHYSAGRALSRYNVGRIGETIKAVKYGGAALPSDIVDLALEQLRLPNGPYAGASFDAVVSIPSTSSTMVASFGASLAQRLGIPWVELQKTRTTDPQKRFRSRERKKRNIVDAFELSEGQYQCVLLVDDILDSGESLRAASTALHPATVYPLVLARAKHQDDS